MFYSLDAGWVPPSLRERERERVSVSSRRTAATARRAPNGGQSSATPPWSRDTSDIRRPPALQLRLIHLVPRGQRRTHPGRVVLENQVESARPSREKVHHTTSVENVGIVHRNTPVPCA
jgi:hypothetical protein